MNEIERDFRSDCIEKKSVARSARYKRTHTGKGGRVRLPSDNLTKKELEKMNGECKAYRMNDPMSWQEFKELPDDLKVTYIKLLRDKFDASTAHIADMLGVSTWSLSKILREFGLADPKGTRRHTQEDAWKEWRNGGKAAEPVDDSACTEGDTCENEDCAAVTCTCDRLRAAEDYILELGRENEKLRRELQKLNEEKETLTEAVPDMKKFVPKEWHDSLVRSLERQNEILREKMAVVELIFGSKCCG